MLGAVEGMTFILCAIHNASQPTPPQGGVQGYPWLDCQELLRTLCVIFMEINVAPPLICDRVLNMNNPLKEEPKSISPSDLLDILCESWGFSLQSETGSEIYHYDDNVETIRDTFSLFSRQDGHDLLFKLDKCDAKIYADGLIELTSKLKQKFKFLVLQEMRVREFVEKRWD
jgi:hypothetical protein